MGLAATPATPATPTFWAWKKVIGEIGGRRPPQKVGVAGVAGVAESLVKSKSKNKRIG